MNNGTFACPESFTCKRATTIKRKPIAEENNNLCAVDFELDWHENKIIPINAQPAPYFFAMLHQRPLHPDFQQALETSIG